MFNIIFCTLIPGCILAFLEIAYWLKLTERIGHVTISISRVMTDIFTITVNYLLILCTISLCIFYASMDQTYFNPYHLGYIYKYMKGNQTNSEVWFTNILVTLFWEIFDPGPDENTFEQTNEFSTHLTIMLYAFYQIFAVIVMLNLLIAIMNSTIQKIQDKKMLYWKFERTAIWLDFINASYYHTIPPPFSIFGNIFLMFMMIPLCIEIVWKKCKPRLAHKQVLYRKYSSKKYKCNMTTQEQKRRQKHALVMNNLINRYLKME